MLHILLLILKIIGIIFAAILGILVLLVCIVLFVPVRYDIEASCDGTLDGIRAKVKATWLLHLVRFGACYEKKELDWRLRIAWKNKQSGQEDNEKIKKEVEANDEELEELWKDYEEDVEEESEESPEAERNLEEESEESPEAERNLEEESKESLEIERNLEKPWEEEKDKPYEKLEEKCQKFTQVWEEIQDNPEETGSQLEETEADTGEEFEKTETGFDKELEENEWSSEEERKHIWQKITEFCQKIYQKIKAIYQKVAVLPEKITGIIQNICGRIDELTGKKEKIFDFLADEVHKTAFGKVKKEGIWLLRKLKPQKFWVKIRYGFEDPYLTGKILAVCSMLYPFMGGNVNIYPDFERKILKGQLKTAGKIRASCFVKILWNLAWCKEVRMTYRHVKEFRL